MPDIAPAPSLSAFLVAAGLGGAIQLQPGGSAIEAVPAAEGVLGSAWPLFEAALAEHFGADIAALALRALPPVARSRPLTAQAVQDAVAAAESQCTMSDARQALLRMECSALLLGRRYCALCAELGLDPRALPAERRQALDEAVGWHPGLRAAQAETRLRELLLRPRLN